MGAGSMVRPIRHAAMAAAVLVAAMVPAARPAAQQQAPVTFAEHVAPILQRSCQRCHRPGTSAPMSLLTYEEARPWAAAIKRQTSSRLMPPWHVERNVGVTRYRNDPSLRDDEIATLATWADSGARRGETSRMPAPPPAAAFEWTMGVPDLIVSSPPVTVSAGAPDWWGAIGAAPTGLTEDRYVAAVETREVSEHPGTAVVHHGGFQALAPDGQFELGSIHEVGRNAEVYDEDAAPRLRAGSTLVFNNAHLHAAGETVTARLVVAFKFLPRGHTPAFVMRGITLGNPELDIRGNTRDQRFEAFLTLRTPAKLLSLEPHMHAAGARMCLDAIWGVVQETLTCVGFDPRWVRTYAYEPDAAPLLPSGTTLRLVGWMDTTPARKNPYLADFRNWTGWGSRPTDNMFMSYLSVVLLNGEQLKALAQERMSRIRRGEADAAGCLPCTLPYARDPGTAR